MEPLLNQPPKDFQPALSLSKSLTRRVLLLSFITVIGLGSVMIQHLTINLDRVRAHMYGKNIEATRDIDEFFIEIKRDMIATGDGLASRNDKDMALLALRTRNKSLSDVIFIDPDRTIVAGRNAFGSSGQKKIEQPAWIGSQLESGSVAIGPVGFEGLIPFVEMATPVTNGTRLPAGFLIARVDLTELWNAILDINVGNTGYAFIADNTGQVIAFRNNRLTETGNSLEKMIGRTPQAIVAAGLSIYTGMNDELVVASAQPLNTVPWFVVLEQPLNDALSLFMQATVVLLAILCIVGVVLVDFIRFTHARIVSPLIVLRNAVMRMADGRIDLNVDISFGDELGQLTQLFNRMSGQLKQAFADLENRIDALRKTQAALRESETERKLAEEALQKQSRLQELLVSISAAYINLPLDIVESTVHQSLRDLAVFVEADRAHIFDSEVQQGFLNCTYEWCREGIEPVKDIFLMFDIADYPDIDIAALRNGRPFYIPDVRSLPPGTLRNLLADHGSKTVLIVPLMHSGQCIGLVNFGWVRRIHSCSAVEQNLLEIFSSILANITERKHAEEALRESEKRYRRLLESVTDYVYFVKMEDGRPVATIHEQGCEAVTGYRPEEYVSDSGLWFRMVYEQDRPAVMQNIALVIAGDSSSFEHRIIHKDGSVRWVRNALVPHYDDRGLLVAYDGIIADITGRKRAEEKMMESEEQFRSTFEQAAVGMAHVAPDGKWLRVNKRLCDMLGYSCDEMLLKSFQEITHPDDLIADIDNLNRMLKREIRSFSREKRYYRKDGSLIWVNLTVSIYSGGIDTHTYLISVIEDITDRKHAEESMLLLNKTIDVASDGVYWMDIEGRFVYVNDAGCKILGYGKDEFMNLRIFDVNPGVNAERWAKLWEQMREHNDYTSESEHRRKDGSVFPVEIVSKYVKFGDKEYINGFARDITARKQVENALRESETRFRAMFENSRDAIIVSIKGELVFANPAFYELYGYESTYNIAGTSVLDHIAPSHHRQIEEYIRRRASGEEAPSFFEIRARRADGTEFDAEVTVSTYELSGERYSVAIIRNVTERKQIEQERYLLQEKVIQAAKMTSLGLMVSGVGHEINNPNQVILSNMQYFSMAWKNMHPVLDEYYRANGDFMVGGIKFSEIRNDLASIIEDTITSSKRIKAIVDDLRTYSRKEDYKDASKIDLNKVLQSSISLVRGMLNNSTNNLSVQYASGMLAINANFQRVEQVLVNLIQNACQALPDRTSAITIVTGKRDAEVYVRITDEGLGMDDETLANLKTPFFTTKREYGGMGLGLFVSDNIVKTYGGTLAVTTVQGKGTEVTIIFPETR